MRQELVQQAAAHVPDHAEGVHHRCHGGRQHGVNGKQQRRDKQEGEFERFGNTHQHRGKRGRDQQPRDLDAVFRRRGVPDRQRNPDRAKHFGVAVQREPAFREEGFQRQGALAEFLQVLRPVDLNPALNRRRAEDERTVDEVVQSGWDQNAFQEGIHPDTERTGRA